MGKPDARKAGHSKVVPYRYGEPPAHRHARRLAAANAQADGVRQWCQRRGIELVIRNDGHHWTFRKDGRVVEWWPSSAKLVAAKRWRRGVHVHDHDQAKHWVARALLNGRA